MIQSIQGSSIRLIASFSSETMKQWDDIFKVPKVINCPPKILYPAKLSFTDDGEIKIYPNKQKLKDILATRPALKEIRECFMFKEKNMRQYLKPIYMQK